LRCQQQVVLEAGCACKARFEVEYGPVLIPLTKDLGGLLRMYWAG